MSMHDWPRPQATRDFLLRFGLWPIWLVFAVGLFHHSDIAFWPKAFLTVAAAWCVRVISRPSPEPLEPDARVQGSPPRILTLQSRIEELNSERDELRDQLRAEQSARVADRRLNRFLRGLFRQSSPEKAIYSLLKELVPDAAGGLALWVEREHGLITIPASRGFKGGQATNPVIDDQFLEIEKPFVTLESRTLRKSKFFQNLPDHAQKKISSLSVVTSPQMRRCQGYLLTSGNLNHLLPEAESDRLLMDLVAFLQPDDKEDLVPVSPSAELLEPPPSERPAIDPRALESILKPLLEQLPIDQISFRPPAALGAADDQGVQIFRRKDTPPIVQIRKEFETRIWHTAPRNRPFAIFDGLALNALGISHSIGWALFVPLDQDGGTSSGLMLMHSHPPEAQTRCVKLAVGCVQILAKLYGIEPKSQAEELQFLKQATRPIEAESDAAVLPEPPSTDPSRDLIAQTSHEIRNPLHGIVGITRLLGETDLSGEQQAYLQVLQSSSDHLMDLVNNLLDQQKLRAGKLLLDPQPIGLRAFLTDCIRLQATTAHQKGLEISLAVEPSIPDRLVVDDMRLRQILVNLLSNAIKFTNSGEVGLRVREGHAEPNSSAADGRRWLSFTVEDTGIGIAADAVDSLFDDYVQADRTTARQFGGTGLGLGICQELIHLMGGQISVTSRPNKGTTIRFHIPLEPSPDATGHSPITTNPARILIVGESERATKCLAESFCPSIAVIELANSVEQVTRFIRLDWDLIVLDIPVKPTKDTSELAKRCQQSDTQTPLTLLRPTSLDQSIRELASHPAWKPLLKPVLPEEILARLTPAPRDLANRAHSGEIPGTGHSPTTCLIADDDPINRRLLKHELSKRGYVATEASDGAVALEVASQQDFDVLFLDVSMPRLSGIELVQQLRRQGHGRPIIAVTGYESSSRISELENAGFSGVLTKPWSLDDLQQTLGTLAQSPDRELPVGGEEPPLINHNEIFDTRIGDPELRQELMVLFLESIEQPMSQIQDAVHHRDASAFEAAAHRIKGAASAMGAVQVESAILKMEEHHAQGRWANTEEFLSPLTDALDQVRQFANQTSHQKSSLQSGFPAVLQSGRQF